MSHLLPRCKLSFDEVLHSLAARSALPSTTGAMLDRLRDGLIVRSGEAPCATSEQVLRQEVRMLVDAARIRCVDELAAVDSIRFALCDSLRTFAAKAKMGDGICVVRCLMAYETWATQSEERGFAAVYEWMRTLDRKLPPASADTASTTEAFRTGKAKRARTKAADIVADSLVVLGQWVERWNRNVKEQP